MKWLPKLVCIKHYGNIFFFMTIRMEFVNAFYKLYKYMQDNKSKLFMWINEPTYEIYFLWKNPSQKVYKVIIL